jgi:hypothetical protein
MDDRNAQDRAGPLSPANHIPQLASAEAPQQIKL